MKKIICFIAMIVLAETSFAQNVGININGATPRNCAMLDIVSSNTGLLIPNLALTSITTYAPATGTAVDGLLIYNTASGVGSGTGYYYWSVPGAKWVNLLDNYPAGDWSLIGNSGTTASTSAIGTAVNNNFMGTTDNTSVVFASNNLERMRILNTGNVGINNTAPTVKLQVTETNSANNAVIFENTAAAGASGGRANYSYSAQSNSSTTYTQNQNTTGTGVDGAGNNVGGFILGGGSGGAFTGSTYGLYAKTTATGGDAGYFSATGEGIYVTTANPATYWGIYVGAGGGYSVGAGSWVSSDKRFKKNITPLSNGTLSKIMQLNPCQYDFDTEKYPVFRGSEGKHFGLIAQEVEKVFPELVNNSKFIPDPTKEETIITSSARNGEGIVNPAPKVSGYYAVDYTSLIPFLIKGIQEQQLQIEYLKKQLEEQSKRIKELESKK